MNFPFDIVYDATMKLLPPGMDNPKAKAMLIAIGLQESRFEHRKQMNDGPARGFWQFEQGGGVRGVLTHPATKHVAKSLLDRLGYDDYPALVWNAIEHNDILAMGFARLNLYWLPQALPGPEHTHEAWAQYLNAWRPGKPHPETWAGYYAQAWQVV